MSKQELIERIMRVNRSARREFLNGFTLRELSDYLDQIQAAFGVRPAPFELIPEDLPVAAAI